MNKIFTFLVAVAVVFPIVLKAESTIYVFDNYPFQKMAGLSFNGDEISLADRPLLKEKMGMKEYVKGLTKITVKNDGRLLVVREFEWAGKPYHDEMTIDLNDGDVYYLELVSGPKSTLKLLKAQDGEKKLRELPKKKDWTVFPDQSYDK